MALTCKLLALALAFVACTVSGEDAPSIETNGGDMEFRLRREDAEATFSREKRETVTIFTLASDIGTLQRQMAAVEASVSSLPSSIDALATAVKAQVDSVKRIDDLVGKVSDAQASAKTLDGQMTEVKNTLATVSSKLSGIDGIKSDLSDVTREVASLGSIRSDMEKALATSEAKVTTQVNAAVAEAKREAESAVNSVSGTETFYVNWNRQSCRGSGVKTLYWGFTWGNHHDHSGGANPLCIKYGANVGGTSYTDSVDQLYYIGTDHCGSPPNVDCNRPTACAMCHVQKPCYMELGTGQCSHEDYETQYDGHMFGGHHSHKANTERICLDRAGQYSSSGQSGAYIYPSATQNDFGGRTGDRLITCNWCCKK